MKCLEQSCDKEIQSKTGRRKFCSDKCKMKHFRKHGKKDVATKFDVQSMINEFKAMVQDFAGKMNYGQVPTILDAPRVVDLRSDEPPQFEAPKTKTFKSQDYFESQIIEGVCEDADGHRQFIEELNESDLPNHVKQQLIAASRVRQS